MALNCKQPNVQLLKKSLNWNCDIFIHWNTEALKSIQNLQLQRYNITWINPTNISKRRYITWFYLHIIQNSQNVSIVFRSHYSIILGAQKWEERGRDLCYGNALFLCLGAKWIWWLLENSPNLGCILMISALCYMYHIFQTIRLILPQFGKNNGC